MEAKLKEKFGSVVNKAYFEKEDGLQFLRVELNLTKLDEVAAQARLISTFLDEVDYSEKEYYLDVFSSGTEKTLDKNNLGESIGDNVFVSLKEALKGKEDFEGVLLETNEEELTIKWNAKGQFRKQIIKLTNIEEIRFSSSVKKGK